MRLILRQYLAALKERDELDAMLPDLLTAMGLDVFSKPGVGNRQYGVDIAAYGQLGNKPEKVYLFSVKAGDLGRSDWNSGSVQDLQPSLDEILTVYISTHLPSEYKDKPVEICICFGGDIDEKVRLNISQYQEKNSTERITFSEWGGEKLSQSIEKYMLKEELLPKEYRAHIRKSLAFVDEPEISFRHFSALIDELFESSKETDRKKLSALRQLHLSLWILYAWCTDKENIESAYLASECVLLHTWEICKCYIGKKNKTATMIFTSLDSIRNLHFIISNKYIDDFINPHVGNLHALSSAVNPYCGVDTNLKLFDILGRLAMSGIWIQWIIQSAESDEVDRSEFLKSAYKKLYSTRDAIKQLVLNNPVLLTPYKDSQGIDIFLAVWLLAIDARNDESIRAWLMQVVRAARFSFECHSNYPCNLEAYYELIEYPEEKTDEYRKDITTGSILYPIVGAFAAVLGLDDVYHELQSFYKESLTHCNMQIWYPDSGSESVYYTNLDRHGATLSHVALDGSESEFLEQILGECDHSKIYEELSAMKCNYWPLILLASRHYRIPVPFHFIQGLRELPAKSVDEASCKKF